MRAGRLFPGAVIDQDRYPLTGSGRVIAEARAQLEDRGAAELAGFETVQVLPMEPGTLLLFQGRDSLHRVTPVSGPDARLVALLAYDAQPAATGTQELHRERYGRTVPYTHPPDPRT